MVVHLSWIMYVIYISVGSEVLNLAIEMQTELGVKVAYHCITV